MELNEAIIELNKNGLRVLNEYKITSDFNELSAEDKTAFSKLMNRYYDSVKIKDESKKKDRLKEVKKSLKEFLKKVKNSSAKAKIQKAIDNCSNVIGKEEDKKETKKTVTRRKPKKFWPNGPEDLDDFGYFFIKRQEYDSFKENKKAYYFQIITDDDWDSMNKYDKESLLNKGYYTIEERGRFSRTTYYISPISVEEAKQAKSNEIIEDFVKVSGLSFNEFIIQFAKTGYMKIIPPEIEEILGKKKTLNYKGPTNFSNGKSFSKDESFYILKYYRDSYRSYGQWFDSVTNYTVCNYNELTKKISEMNVKPNEKEKLFSGERANGYNESYSYYYQLVRYSDITDSVNKKRVTKSLLISWKLGKIDGLPIELQKYARKLDSGNHELVIKNRRLSCSYNERSKEPYSVTKRAFNELSKYIDDYVKSKYGKVYDIVKTCGCKEGYDSEDEEYYWFDAYYPIELDEYILKRMKYYVNSTYWVEISYREGSKTIKY